MRHWRVRDVMTSDVVAVREDTPFRQIVDVLAERGVSAVPVVDSVGHVVGVVSEADLLHKMEFAGEVPERHLLEGRRRRVARTKATGDVARELMTSPAVTVFADTSVIEAARIVYGENVKRLPVIDELGRLVGIVSRGDLLRVHLRPDEEIHGEIVDYVLAKVLWVQPGQVRVRVDGGVVKLTGQLDRRTDCELAVHLTRAIAGVVDVVDELSFGFDDTLATSSRTFRSYPFNVR